MGLGEFSGPVDRARYAPRMIIAEFKFAPRDLALWLFSAALAFGCAPPESSSVVDAGPLADSSHDAHHAPMDASQDAETARDGSVDAPPTDGAPPACSAPFRPMVAHDMSDLGLGEDFLDWRRSVADDTHSFTRGRAVRVRTNPGEELLPACSGGPFFAGRSRLPAPVPIGRTIWYQVHQYIPSTFSFGYKYSSGDRDAARSCSQPSDGNSSLKWLVLAPDVGTARIYMNPSVARRSVDPVERNLRVVSEALHELCIARDVHLPRDRWFSLQMAVRVSAGDDGFIRLWMDGEFLVEVEGRTVGPATALIEWGLGDYWNGVPWTDGAEGRTDFWVDEIIVASDADGYDAPTGVDSGGRTYIAPCTRVADLPD